MRGDLYDRPDLYDLIAQPDLVMQGFYVETARSLGPRVLDLACGTGRFSIALAEAGLTVTGGDLSASMLDRARQSAEVRGLSIDFVALDMRDFDLSGRTFDTVMIAANSLLHLHTHAEFTGFFSSVARHLAPQGRLLFDVFVPSLKLLTLAPNDRQLVGRFPHPALGKVTLEETIVYDPVTQISQADWYWSTPDAPDFWANSLTLRQIFPQEMPLLSRLGGLELLERYGNFDRSPLSAETYRQVCVCGHP
ncbi:class I SAM-dependent methyltransferase [Devosia sp.]|uniref:class I SAM-dependent methyltransferase n=1 Tax=Devosia sp. TaxID=1871048 RepID=UPI003BA8ADE7